MTDSTLLHPIKRVLISVSDKSGLEELARQLTEYGAEILSTGGTAKKLTEWGIPNTDVSDHTGFPEMMDGRVKTLHPKIHGGLLALRDNDEHLNAMQQHDIAPIDMVIVNLYPFEQTVAKGAEAEEVIENIDIGGPSMLRSAAKNHAFVTVVTDPEDYPLVMQELTTHKGATGFALRRDLAAKTFARTASYDAAISAWFQREFAGDEGKGAFRSRITFAATQKQPLRYGENPHQNAAFYVTDATVPGVANATQIQGKELSYNNINDTDAAFALVSEFSEPAAAIIKHACPCGVATARDLATAYAQALASDPVSAFGGIIALNRALDEATANQIVDLFAEVVIAPTIDEPARQILSAKKNLRLLVTGSMPQANRKEIMMKTVMGGLLVQDVDTYSVSAEQLKIVTKSEPTQDEIRDMLFAFSVGKHVKSNAIVLAKDGATVGVGGGQTSRVDAVRNAIHQANSTEDGIKRAGGAVLASDAFFPFADNIMLAAAAGVRAIIQPGGSVRDKEVIAAANDAGIAMVFTGSRHFKH